MPTKNDWNEYKNLFLDFKENTEKRLDVHDKKLDRLLEVTSGMRVKIGIGAGLIATAISLVVKYLT